MKNIETKNLLQMFFAFLISVTVISCSEERNSFQRDRNPEIESLGVYLSQLETLRDNSTYGVSKGQYPEESKDILNDAMAVLGRLIIKLDENQSVTQSEMDQAIANAGTAITNFKATIRTESVKYPAELYVNGSDGGYINFGTSNDYLNFGTAKNREFTVELWVKLKTMPSGIGAIVSTFLENGGIRCGWMMNMINGDYMRITYAQKAEHQLWEPGNGFTETNKWHHIAAVYSDNGVDGEMENGNPVVAKFYYDGEFKSKIVRSSTDNYYGANDNGLPSLPMIAFAQYQTDGSFDRKSQGYIKHFHIWNSAKNGQELKNIMNGTTEVVGSESDLVCGWEFDSTVEDDQNIKDLTGKHTASVKGKYEWQIISQ